MFSWFKKSVSGVIGIELSPLGPAVAYLSDKRQDGLPKADCEHWPDKTLDDCLADLERWLSERGLNHVPLHVVLHPSMYTLYFVDRPDVDDQDLSDAVQWKIKDLVDQPMKDLVIDAFALPEDAYRGMQKKVYAVAMDRQVLEHQVELLKTLPVVIQGVSISELVDRSILNLLAEDDGGAALLRLRRATATINLVDGGDLYLTRNIDSSVSVLESATEQNRDQVFDDLLLEIQRCVDFYDSQLGKGAIRRMMVAPTKLDHSEFDEHLRHHLGMSVQTLDLNQAFVFPEPISVEVQSHCFAAVAAATEYRGLVQ